MSGQESGNFPIGPNWLEVRKDLSDNPEFRLEIRLDREHLEVISNALHYTARMMVRGGSDPDSSIELLRSLHAAIREQTGIHGYM